MTARIGVVGIGWWATFNHIPTVQASGDADIRRAGKAWRRDAGPVNGYPWTEERGRSC